MIDAAALDGWLTRTNERYRAEELHAKARPFKAMSDFTSEHHCSLSFDSPTAKAIFQWFYARSAPDAHHVGALFTGAFYFDATFWPVSVPLGYGTFKLDAFDCLETMPSTLKEQLAKSHKDMWGLALHWADCVDYGYGFDDMGKLKVLTPRAFAFAENADRELVGAIAQILTPRPNPKAILAFRMSTEIHLKAVLIQERGLTDAQLRGLSHKIEDVARECFDVTGQQVFEAVAKHASVFPKVSDRYDGDECSTSELWKAVVVAQTAAAAVARRYSDRDLRSHVLDSARKP